MKVRLALEAAERIRQATGVGIVPAWLVQLSAVPGNVRQTALIHLPLEVTTGTSGTEIMTCGDEQLPEAQERAVLFRQAPVEPADLIVLAVGVVVALLGAPQTAEDDRTGRHVTA